MSSIQVFLSPRHNLYHSGYLISAALHAGAHLTLCPSVHPTALRLEAGGRRHVIEVFDSPRSFDQDGLEYCDVYWKRSYCEAHLPAAYRAKIRPWGLNYACRTFGSIPRVLALYGSHLRATDQYKDYLLSPRPHDFERSCDTTPVAGILFQTRLWAYDQFGPDDRPDELNGFRVELVRELKRTFKERFFGGLVPTPEAQPYPELITSLAHRRWQYAASARLPAIGIYTRGLHGSNAFKLAEYLASSKCIVGESLGQTLDVPLDECHCVHETIAGIIAECDELLAHPDRLRSIQRASWNYYQTRIRYDRRLDTLLGRIRSSGAIS